MASTPRRSDEDFAAEIEAHIALEADQLRADGVRADEARAAAHRRFGNAVRVRERFHESRRWLWLDQCAGDLRHAARSLARYPFSCLVAVVSLAAGIGAATATLMVRQAVFTSPPPLYADAERLSTVGMGVAERTPGPVPAALFSRWSEDGQLAAMLAAARAERIMDARAGDRVETVPVRAVSANVFAMLGVPAALGRTLDAAVDASGPVPVVLSHGAWRRLFDGDEDAVGRVIWLDQAPYTVVGVMPEFFWLLSMDAPVWTPLDPRTLAPDDRVSIIARRPPDMTAPDLGERLQPAVAWYAQSLPAAQRHVRAVVSGIEGTPMGRAVGPMILVLLTTSVLLTLLIACTNVALLMIAQWTTREHEIAVRASLGASRGRLVRALVGEAALIALAGGALGLSVTLALRAYLLGSDATPQFNLTLDYRIFVQAALLTALAGLLTGVAPALYETRLLHINPIRRMRLSDGVRQRWRHALVVFEIAVTVALLVVTGALVSASRRMMSTQPGFDPHVLAGVHVENAGRVPLSAARENLARLPGVAGVALASHVPVVAPPPSQPVSLTSSSDGDLRAERTLIGPGFFDTLGVALRAGRSVTRRDDAHGVPVAVVNQALADRLWPGRSPLGASLWSQQMAYEVVGVVADYGNTPLRQPRPAFYVPVAQAPELKSVFFLVRATSGLERADWRAPAEIEAALRGEMLRVAPATDLSTFTLDRILDIGGRELLVGAAPLAPLVATGLLLTAAGIFGVLAFSVARRANELAVRVAVGAGRADLWRLVAAQSARLVGLGMLLGVAATFALTRVAQGSGNVFDSPGWQAFVVPIAIVGLIAVLATWIPLRRAMAINPATLLRST